MWQIWSLLCIITINPCSALCTISTGTERYGRLNTWILCGQDPKLWPVSPVKLGQPAQAGPSILDVEFTDEEDEEDDEYEPSRDVEVTWL